MHPGDYLGWKGGFWPEKEKSEVKEKNCLSYKKKKKESGVFEKREREGCSRRHKKE